MREKLKTWSSITSWLTLAPCSSGATPSNSTLSSATTCLAICCPMRRPCLRARSACCRPPPWARRTPTRASGGRSMSRCTARRPTSPARASPTRSRQLQATAWRCATLAGSYAKPISSRQQSPARWRGACAPATSCSPTCARWAPPKWAKPSSQKSRSWRAEVHPGADPCRASNDWRARITGRVVCGTAPHKTRGKRAGGGLWRRARPRPSSTHLIECMLSVAGVGTHLARPATQLRLLCPLGTEQHLGTVDLEDGSVAGTLVLLLGHDAADAHGERFAHEARGTAHAGNLENVGHVLAVVDLIEQRLLVRIHVHAHDKQVFRAGRHAASSFSGSRQYLSTLACSGPMRRPKRLCYATPDRPIAGPAMTKNVAPETVAAQASGTIDQETGGIVP